ncbi:MAG TPA: enoyl-CoA hydratase-related protein [Acidimicrobiales bacterium]|jgi:enoyl-CoA hydratase/carnithine racemase|nr:enoyl-CoA hydratase-related protein [Acidimicrobiales bacterium]
MVAVYEQIIYSVDDPVAIITLNRPAQLNAWTDQMAAEVRHAVYTAERDPAVVGIIVTGAGRAFCAGADLKVLENITEGERSQKPGEGLDLTPPRPIPQEFDGTYTWLMAVQKPVIAAINGAVAGMAVPISLCCDLRFMAADAPLLTAFAQRGLIAEWGLSWLLTRMVGTGQALDLLFSSRKVSGEEAAAMGLVNKALPADEVLPYAIQYVKDLAAKCSPASISIMKRQVYEQLTATLAPSEKESIRLMIESFDRPDFKEGVFSFLQKRPPKFGRLGESAEG